MVPLPAAGITVYFRLLTDTCTIVVGSDISEVRVQVVGATTEALTGSMSMVQSGVFHMVLKLDW